ncbi:uncharacterized protein [Prorops nasuta]
MFWRDVFGGHCPFWANLEAAPVTKILEDIYFDMTEKTYSHLNYTDWKEHIIVQEEYQPRCQAYYIISCCSCVFGVIWVTLFSICGKGGYATTIYPAPWRVVLPAFVFSTLFSIITMFLSQDMQKGYAKFSTDIFKLYNQVSKYNNSESHDSYRICDTIQDYAKMYNPHKHNVCYFFLALNILSWIMSWSWIAALLVLILRVLNFNDFRILRIQIHEVTEDFAQSSTSSSNSSELTVENEFYKEKNG